ncbi:MAG: ATP synthase F1 subunit delta [bacterium]|nr:ATP synthase F1 subunit delta [bacterium]MBK8128492.1 ATP synthase F1 subunit delta [bacterium]
MKSLDSALALRYARSLFLASLQAKCSTEVEHDLQALAAIYRENRELPVLLASPTLGNTKRRAILFSIGDKVGFCEMTRRFIDVLLEKSRLDVLPAIPDRFHRLFREHEGEVEVTVQTAIALSDAMKQSVADSIAKTSGKKPVIAYKVNPAIIGGIVIQYPDHILDGSLARKVHDLGKRMSAAV